MKRMLLPVFVISGILFFVAHSAQATLIKVDFTAVGFTDMTPDSNIPPPTDPVSGFIVYNAASTTANIDSLSSISLTIKGHTYGIAEIGFHPSPPYSGEAMMIGGLVNGVVGVSPGFDDF